MKILIAAEIFPPDIGGPATYAEKLATELTKQGHEVVVVCYSTEEKNDNLPFKIVRVLRGQNTLFRYIEYLIKLFKLARNFEVIYAQGPVSSGLPALIIAKLLGVRLVIKVVGDYAWEQAVNLKKTKLLIDDFQKEQPRGKIYWLKKIEAKVAKSADIVVAPSFYLKKIVIGWGVPENNIEVIYNAADKKIFTETLNMDIDKDIILSIGRLVPWKGFEVLIDLMPELLKENSNFKLVILGAGPMQERLKIQSSKLKIEDRVEIKKVDSLERDKYLQVAKIFVLNTGYEGLSHTILEAQTAGAPIITTSVCGNPELVKDGETGLLVEYNNKEQLKAAILKLWKNKELGKTLVENAKKELNKFSFEEMISKTIAILGGKQD